MTDSFLHPMPVLDGHAVSITVTLPGVPVHQVATWLDDPEHLLHLNPFLEIRTWEVVPHPRVVIWRLQALNEMNGLLMENTLTRRPTDQGDGYILSYRTGLKNDTCIRWWDDGVGGTVVEIRETYNIRPGVNGKERLREVDPTLAAWAGQLRDHFVSLQRFSWLPLYAGYRQRFWWRLTPNQRRWLRGVLWTIPLEILILGIFIAYYLSH